MVDRVQNSPSIGNKNQSEPSVSKYSKQSVISTAGGPGEISGVPEAPVAEPVVAESNTARKNRRSPAEKAQDQQRILNSLTVAVKREVAKGTNTQELIRESVGDFLEENQPNPDVSTGDFGRGESYDASAADVSMPSLNESEAASPPAPEVPKTEPPPAVKRDSGGGDRDDVRGDVVDVVS